MTSVSRKGISIRGKLTLAALAPLVTILLLVAIAAFYLINAWIVGNAQQQVRSDLSAAHEVLQNEEEHIRDIIRLTASTAGFAENLTAGRLNTVNDTLKQIKDQEGLDLLTLTDRTGQLLNKSGPGSGPPPPFVRQVLSGKNFSGAVLFSEQELLREGNGLSQQARVEYRESPDKTEERGMFLIGAAPLRNERQEVIGCLYGGILLNRNLELVDRIKNVLYGEQLYQATDIGSATIFLDGLRVATTVRLKNGDRALGTEISAEVAEVVLKKKQTWLARAEVVDEWYLTAYEPILDPDGEAIGSLYVGELEEPFNALKRKSALLLFGLLLLGSSLGLLISLAISRRLSRPLLDLATSTKRVAAGDTEIVLPVSSLDEVGHLTENFNQMTATLRERDQRLLGLNRELEEKVRLRTAELEEKGLQLIQAQEELLGQEKLAAIGSLAAGVAHEINNPTAIIRGNVELLQMTLEQDMPGREEVDEIKTQTERVALITRNLLSFAREQTIHPEQVQLNDLLAEILDQLSHQVNLDGVQLKKEFAADLPVVEGDRERLRQVFNNITLNAVQAMNGKGILAMTTYAAESGVRIRIQDTGCGLAEGTREKIFNPFFTTKKNGTGLGLSVSYGIVQAHKGTIEVLPTPEKGTSFLIHLPLQK